MSELIGSLEAHEKRLMAQDEDSIERAFQSKINMQSHQSKNDGRSSWKNKGGVVTTQKEKYPIEFASKTIVWREIANLGKNHNATLVKDMATLKKIVTQKQIIEPILWKKKKV